MMFSCDLSSIFPLFSYARKSKVPRLGVSVGLEAVIDCRVLTPLSRASILSAYHKCIVRGRLRC